jgi:hypothetical protein
MDDAGLSERFHIPRQTISYYNSVQSQGSVLRFVFRKTKDKKNSYTLDVRGSVHHSKIHNEKSNKMQQCIRLLLLHIYMKLNMFRATHRPSSGA